MKNKVEEVLVKEITGEAKWEMIPSVEFQVFRARVRDWSVYSMVLPSGKKALLVTNDDVGFALTDLLAERVYDRVRKMMEN